MPLSPINQFNPDIIFLYLYHIIYLIIDHFHLFHQSSSILIHKFLYNFHYFIQLPHIQFLHHQKPSIFFKTDLLQQFKTTDAIQYSFFHKFILFIYLTGPLIAIFLNDISEVFAYGLEKYFCSIGICI
jgi:hypothetical protein